MVIINTVKLLTSVGTKFRVFLKKKKDNLRALNFVDFKIFLDINQIFCIFGDTWLTHEIHQNKCAMKYNCFTVYA